MQKIMQKDEQMTLTVNIALIIAVLMTMYYLFSTQHSHQLMVRNEKVIKIAHDIDRHVAGRVLSLKVLASGLVAHKINDDTVKLSLNRGNAKLNLSGFGLYDAAGKLRVSIPNYSGQLSPEEKAFFSKVIAGQDIVTSSRGGSRFGSYYVRYLIPVYNQANEVFAILVAEESLYSIARAVESFFLIFKRTNLLMLLIIMDILFIIRSTKKLANCVIMKKRLRNYLQTEMAL